MFSLPQVFVAAARMEYLVTKDKTIALKIFELGMKKFGDEPKYIMTFLDHLTHLNGTLPTVNTFW